jgi:hypothetical protein
MRSIVRSVHPGEFEEGGEHVGPAADQGAQDDTAKN